MSGDEEFAHDYFGGNKMKKILVTQDELEKIINDKITQRVCMDSPNCRIMGVGSIIGVAFKEIDENGCNWRALGIKSDIEGLSDKVADIIHEIEREVEKIYNLR
jgi:hypothetical protein